MLSRRSRSVVVVLCLLAVALTASSAGAHRPGHPLSAPAAAALADAANTKNPAARKIVERAGRWANAVLGARTGPSALADCSSGAHTLSKPGDIVYPEMGNGGYTSLHSDVHINYDAPTNLFLPGTHVDLTDRATQCLTDFSLDFERTNNSTAGGTGPNMTVNSVEVNGQPATFTFVQPTYPGDPNGQDDPDPAAHAVSNANPVSATNPNPPACSPQTSNNSQNGTQCPANKLVITPATPIPSGAVFTVTVDYTGRPGVHVDGDGSTEGWFRVNTAAAPNDGAFVTTEPVGNDSWLPLNNHPSAKPTYDFYDTTNVGKVAVANGELDGFTPGSDFVALQPTTVNPPDANFPGGSWTWHWHSPEPIANYLVENSIGGYDLIGRKGSLTGVAFYEAQASSIAATRKALNKLAMDTQDDITNFESRFNGAFPFTTDGVVVGIPPASFEEEMQTKITFAGGTIGGNAGTSLGTLYHENMHQWFGDNVSENAFNLTFWKEGFARLSEYLNNARTAANAAGGLDTPAGDAAFETSLTNQFNANYGSTSSSFWTGAPSKPTVGTLFTTNFTYNRPATTYIALWHVLGKAGMVASMKQIQGTYGGSSITEQQLEDVFRSHLPTPSASCNQRLDQFFPQWFDTAFPTGGANTTNKPKITGPGLNGTGFVCAQVAPAAPDGNNGWYKGNVSVTWQGFGTPPVTKDGCVDGAIADDGVITRSCSVTTTTTPILTSGAVSETVKHDATPPVVTYSGNAGTYTVDQDVSITCAASDATSGVASTTCEDVSGPAYSFGLGSHTFSATAEDVAGNDASGQTTFTVTVTFDSLANLVDRFSTSDDVTAGLVDKLAAAATAKNAKTRANQLNAFENQVRAQTDKALPAVQAQLLIDLAEALK